VQQNGPSDEIPLTNSHRNHWLNVENVLVSGKGADRVIEVVLEGNADQRGDRVLCLLDQVVRVIGDALLRLLRQNARQAHQTEHQQTAYWFHPFHGIVLVVGFFIHTL
jgi:hypothetical protein